ncbi:MAG: sulfatase-like hydrolase/transferase, partial [Halobacteriaceae archaeon]
ASTLPTVVSMAAVHTGQLPLTTPEIGFSEDQREEVVRRQKIAELLSDRGYSTGALSPNPPASSYFGYDEGFDWFKDYLDTDSESSYWNKIFEESIQGSKFATYARLSRNLLLRNEILRPWTDFYSDIMEWVEQASEPFFLWILLLDTHHPWLPPRNTQKWSSPKDKYLAFRQYWKLFSKGWDTELSPHEHERLVNLYDDSIRFADKFIGKITNDLADDDPVFLIHSDHGEEFNENGRYGHQPRLSPELSHVPLIISNSDYTGRTTHPVGLKSIAPTIADLADVRFPYNTQSLLNYKSSKPWEVSKILRTDGAEISIRTSNKHYVSHQKDECIFSLNDDDKSKKNDGEALELFRHIKSRHKEDEKQRRLIRDTINNQNLG